MSRPMLAYGAKGKPVEELQKLLNKWIEKKDGKWALLLETDKDFGNKTKEVVEDFQHKKFLYKDGIVGDLTWAALLENEGFNYFDIPANLLRAPDAYRCWAASAAMLLKRNAPLPRTPGVDFESQPDGTLGGIGNSHENMKKFADYHDMTMVRAEGFSCLQLTTLLYRYGRLMLHIKGVNTNMIASSSDNSHLVLMLGARGDGQPSGTTITIYNPSNGGGKITSSFRYLKSRYPRLTYQAFYTLSNRSMPV